MFGTSAYLLYRVAAVRVINRVDPWIYAPRIRAVLKAKLHVPRRIRM